MSRPTKVAIGFIIMMMVTCVIIWWREPLHWFHYHQIEKEGKLRSLITVVEAPEILSPHEKGRCRLEVKNLGTVAWTAADGFRLGGFERDWKLNRVEPARVGNPGRLEVTKDIKQGKTWEVSFDIEAPEKAGEYKLHLQMLREKDISPGVPAPDNTWFGQEQVVRVLVR
jgi:hypothetical protein